MMVFKIIAVQRIFRVATVVTIQKPYVELHVIYGNIQSPRGNFECRSTFGANGTSGHM